MFLTIEEYISKRKKQDGINEFNDTDRVKNMGKVISYVVEYFEAYINQVNVERALIKEKSEKLKKQLKSDFNDEIIVWLIEQYEKHGKRLDRLIANYLKRDPLFLLKYQESEFKWLAEQFIKEQQKKLPFLQDNVNIVCIIIKAFHKKKSLVEIDDFRHRKLGDTILLWLKETKEIYSVNLMEFASAYTDDFYSQNVQFEYNAKYGQVDYVRDYNVKTVVSNYFGIDELYSKVNNLPFLNGKKKHLEILLMYYWLEYIEGEPLFWNTYINKDLDVTQILNRKNSNSFIWVSRNRKNEFNCNIHVLDGHFDIEYVEGVGRYILQTENCSERRKLNLRSFNQYTSLKANKDGLALLWNSNSWATEFACFIQAITLKSNEPEAIEIFPPFRLYETSLESFIEKYKVFEYELLSKFSNTQVWLCNRNKASKGNLEFLIRNADDLTEISKLIDKYKLNLKLSLDLTQLLEAYSRQIQFLRVDTINNVFGKLKDCQHNISAIHALGKKKKGESVDSLDAYFNYNTDKKEALLESLLYITNDETQRFLIPDISGLEVEAKILLNDLFQHGFKFSSNELV